MYSSRCPTRTKAWPQKRIRDDCDFAKENSRRIGVGDNPDCNICAFTETPVHLLTQSPTYTVRRVQMFSALATLGASCQSSAECPRFIGCLVSLYISARQALFTKPEHVRHTFRPRKNANICQNFVLLFVGKGFTLSGDSNCN